MRHFLHGLYSTVVVVSVLASPFGTLAQTSPEREIQLQPQLPPPVVRDSPLEIIGLRKPDIAGLRISAFVVGSFSYNSGLQMDQVTHLYVPAFFINELRLWQDDSLVLTMEGGISISEDPNIRFTYVSNGAKRFRAEARDTEGHVFQKEWNIEDSGM